jgi:hypothetical protein
LPEVDDDSSDGTSALDDVSGLEAASGSLARAAIELGARPSRELSQQQQEPQPRPQQAPASSGSWVY